ncbi:hypothetical protein SCB49_11042 [unidentified eubacterium SCB49]|nr:hypothetical protein SCB49_11042 [unidentified eubacterium SCB49]
MFYYKESAKPKLEVRIPSAYTKEDLERIFLFLKALVFSPSMKVIFLVHNSINEEFANTLLLYSDSMLFQYIIKENVA